MSPPTVDQKTGSEMTARRRLRKVCERVRSTVDVAHAPSIRTARRQFETDASSKKGPRHVVVENRRNKALPPYVPRPLPHSRALRQARELSHSGKAVVSSHGLFAAAARQ
ncbi:hypothetical protein HPB50_008506 [Hyalomma asiaticum]|uniref:Uncharacterized protein n=1 Tax=Hyalomma asiaticum TaxID=266040 RepID=A0ACB7T142_HYAAI|nr:hypothetical protein HPB50_008506 [Hyalomma asiaticum]